MPEREFDGFPHTDPFDLLGEVRQATNRLPVCGHGDVAQLAGRGVETRASRRARPDQFDDVLHFDETRAVEPLETTAEWKAGEVPETFPFAV